MLSFSWKLLRVSEVMLDFWWLEFSTWECVAIFRLITKYVFRCSYMYKLKNYGCSRCMLMVKILNSSWKFRKNTRISQNYFHGLELEVDGEKEMMFIEKESIQFHFLPASPSHG